MKPHSIIGSILNKFERYYIYYKYNSYTIAEYFRKQGAQVGENCSIIITDLGPEPYLVKIGNHVTIAMGVSLITHDGGAWIFRQEIPDLQVYGPIVIEDNCVIGAHATLMPNVRVGPNSIVAAGSVVISDIPPNSIAIGVPARVLGSTERYREKCIERWALQKPAGYHSPGEIVKQPMNSIKKNRQLLRDHLIRVFWQNEDSRHSLSHR
ncbi:acyltransferase [candidate division KSB1 bacterium]|nr:acyltransferase [candidate division KSB1 bacterium]